MPKLLSPELDPAGPPVLVLGAGRSGTAVATFLAGQGFGVTISDVSPLSEGEMSLPDGVKLIVGDQTETLLENCQAVFVSPGVRWDIPMLETARLRGLMVSSEMDLFFRLCPAPIVGITGTNGKTTTTALVGQVLDQTGRPVMVGGNIGETVLDRLAEVTEDHLVVLELSSFQLESISQPNMAVAAVLNLTPDHLDRHGSMSRYIDAKARAVEFLAGDGHAVLNGLDENCRGLAMRTHANVVWFDQHQPLPPVTIPGRHNLLNALAAASIGRILGLDDQRIASSIAAFKGVEHRLELVGNWGGVAWYNDSKATNPEAGEVALQAFPDRPLILIAGGQGQFDLRRWATVVQARAQAVILIGSDPTALADSLSGHPDVRVAGTLDMAVEAAGAIARAGNVVLFSPAFKSFDQFANFEARGRAFKSLVLERGGTR